MARRSIAGAIAATVTAVTLVSPSAHAEPYTQYDQYLDLKWVRFLSTRGVTINNVQAAGALGRAICAMINAQAPLTQVDALVHSRIDAVGPMQTAIIEASAISNYCPTPQSGPLADV
jgi:hypothetical protein